MKLKIAQRLFWGALTALIAVLIIITLTVGTTGVHIGLVVGLIGLYGIITWAHWRQGTFRGEE